MLQLELAVKLIEFKSRISEQSSNAKLTFITAKQHMLFLFFKKINYLQHLHQKAINPTGVKYQFTKRRRQQV